MSFFEQYLAAFIVLALYLIWKFAVTKGKGGFYVRAHQMDLMTGMRQFDLDALEEAAPQRKKSIANAPMRAVRSFI